MDQRVLETSELGLRKITVGQLSSLLLRIARTQSHRTWPATAYWSKWFKLERTRNWTPTPGELLETLLVCDILLLKSVIHARKQWRSSILSQYGPLVDWISFFFQFVDVLLGWAGLLVLSRAQIIRVTTTTISGAPGASPYQVAIACKWRSGASTLKAATITCGYMTVLQAPVPNLLPLLAPGRRPLFIYQLGLGCGLLSIRTAV